MNIHHRDKKLTEEQLEKIKNTQEALVPRRENKKPGRKPVYDEKSIMISINLEEETHQIMQEIAITIYNNISQEDSSMLKGLDSFNKRLSKQSTNTYFSRVNVLFFLIDLWRHHTPTELLNVDLRASKHKTKQRNLMCLMDKKELEFLDKVIVVFVQKEIFKQNEKKRAGRRIAVEHLIQNYYRLYPQK